MSQNIIVKPELTVETQVSLYDRISSLLTAALVILGSVVTFLFLIWLTSVIKFDRQPPAMFFEEQPAGDEKPEGVAEDELEPGVEEFFDVETPQLADALEAVTNALSTVQANNEFRDGDAPAMGKGRGLGSKDGGDGTGKGDVIPEHKRWKIEYQANDINKYAAQLSYFKIDLGAVNKLNNDIFRMVDPGGAGRIVPSDRTKEKKSVYFAHERVQLQRWDETLFKRKGVDMSQSFSVQFYPEETKKLIRQVEGQYLLSNQRQLREVQNTFLKVVAKGNGFEFQVTKQVYRRR